MARLASEVGADLACDCLGIGLQGCNGIDDRTGVVQEGKQKVFRFDGCVPELGDDGLGAGHGLLGLAGETLHRDHDWLLPHLCGDLSALHASEV